MKKRNKTSIYSPIKIVNWLLDGVLWFAIVDFLIDSLLE